MNTAKKHRITAVISAAAIFFAVIPTSAAALSPGGMPFGIKMYTDGIIVSALDRFEGENGSISPATDSGLQLKDIITYTDGEKITSAEALAEKIAASDGRTLKLTVMRGEQELQIDLKPEKCKTDGSYKAGLWVRDSTSGVGTVTFIDPESGSFGGLGHGICDSDTGKILPMLRGTVSEVSICGIAKGAPGAPGELRGYFKGGRIGSLVKNSEVGVFGVLSNLPELNTTVELATPAEVKEGPATILCTLDESGIGEYNVTIGAIDRANSHAGKSFTVTVTDERLIEKTGGIVQGMSGSPILQNGKLIGAVTHVMINDPCRGYGIFIENMRNSMPELIS